MKFGVVIHTIGRHMSFESTLEAIKATTSIRSAVNGSQCRDCQCSGHEQKPRNLAIKVKVMVIKSKI